MVPFWKCCGVTRISETVEVAGESLRQHEIVKHDGKCAGGTFGIADRWSLTHVKVPKKKRARERNSATRRRRGVIGPKEMIRIDTRDPAQACLLPPEWGGKFPRNLTGPERITKLSEQQNHRCCYCGVETWCPHYGEDGPHEQRATVEHITPRTHGGTNKKGNLVMACWQCNNRRGLSNPYVFMMEVQGRLDFELCDL